MAREVIMRFNGFSREGNAPILESVGELVRCKDCRFNRTESCPMTVSYTDNLKHWIYCSPMDFCSFGEKKEEHAANTINTINEVKELLAKMDVPFRTYNFTGKSGADLIYIQYAWTEFRISKHDEPYGYFYVRENGLTYTMHIDDIVEKLGRMKNAVDKLREMKESRNSE